MSYDIHYGDDDDRRALLDLVHWFGFSKAHLIFRETKKCSTMQQLDDIDRAVSFGGVSGRPTLALFRKFFGNNVVQEWRKVPQWRDQGIAFIDDYRVPDDIVDYLEEGNTKRDLITLYWEKLTPSEQEDLKAAVKTFIEDVEEHTNG